MTLCNGITPLPGSCPECGSPIGHNHYCPLTFRQFPTLQAARDHRHANGTGGWIFEDEKTLVAIIFPPDMTCPMRPRT